MIFPLAILTLSILFGLTLSHFRRRAEADHLKNRLDLANKTIRRQRDYILNLESELRRLDGYNQELQRRCSRRQVRLLPGAKFSDYFLSDGGVVRHSRVWWN